MPTGSEPPPPGPPVGLAEKKQALREHHWQVLLESGDALPPGTRGRIPNFRGAEQAAARLASCPAWRAARTLKCNPDTPQHPVRVAALEAGKIVYLAVPKLATERPFVRLDPARIPRERFAEAATPAGAAELGRAASVGEVAAIDLVVTGCVAVTRQGARLGKGAGYSDLEFALLREAGKLGEHTPIVTTVHPSQIAPEGSVVMLEHDLSLDWFATPEALVACPRSFSRPLGIEARRVEPAQRRAIPALDRALSQAPERSPSLRELRSRFARAGRLGFIGLRPARGAPMSLPGEVEARQGFGLVGDRSAQRAGGERQVTLFQLEHLPVLASMLGASHVAPDQLRRNLGVSGINLVALKDQRFFVGEVELVGTGPCAPCRRLEQTLGPGGFNVSRGHGGITARIVSGGMLRLGDAVRFGDAARCEP